MRFSARALRRALSAALAVAVLALTLRPAAGSAAPPNDPLFRSQWNLRLIQIPEAWAVSDGLGATVAILDTGVAYEDYDDGRHVYRKPPGFSATRFAPGYDFVDGDDHPNDNLGRHRDRPAHGTHAAAVIAETANEGQGAAGVAPGARIMPVRVLDWEGDGEVASAAAGIRFAADHGAQVMVMSLAGTDTGPVADAVKYAMSKGVVMVAPSGNQGADQVGYPASDANVIAVGAVAADKTLAYYSNYGPGLDLVAPGGDVSKDLTGDGEPDGIRQQTFVERIDGFCHCQKEGTSSAAPHVAAVAALLVASGLATTPEQVRRALLSSALDLGPPGNDVYFGAGLVQASSALTAAAAEAADLSVTAEDSPASEAGAVVTSSITVANAGPKAATAVHLSDTLSPGAVVRSASTTQGTCDVSGATVTCNLDTLSVGAKATVTVVATADGALKHDGAVRANEGDGNRANNKLGAIEASEETSGSRSGAGAVGAAVLAGALGLAFSVGFGLRRRDRAVRLGRVDRRHRAS